jgi:hypothetical protein
MAETTTTTELNDPAPPPVSQKNIKFETYSPRLFISHTTCLPYQKLDNPTPSPKIKEFETYSSRPTTS